MRAVKSERRPSRKLIRGVNDVRQGFATMQEKGRPFVAASIVEGHSCGAAYGVKAAALQSSG
jgi:hypothetical protein